MRKCKVDGCEGKHYSKGYCKRHYQQFKKYGEDLLPPKEAKCSVDGCNNKHKAKGYCNKHYSQYKTYGRILERTKFDSNEIIEYDDYAEIVLYDKDNIEVARAIIDLEDIDKVSKYKWCLDSKGYVHNTKVGFLHRFITDCPSDKIIDHKNNNPLDNHKSNLRICSQQQNNMNRLKRNDCSSQFKGVYWYKQRNKWCVNIRINNKSKHIGYYTDELTASIEYDKNALLYHGVYAKLNHPIENYYDYILDLGLDINDFDIEA